MHRRLTLAFTTALIAAFVPVAVSATSTWPIYHLDQQHSGKALEPPQSAAIPAWSSPTLDGQLYAEPLYYNSQAIVATENDTVYGLNAADGTIAWSVSVGTPRKNGVWPCGNIRPLGITSTPVIASPGGVPTLFVVSENQTGTGPYTWTFQLTAITLSSHAINWQHDITPPGMDTNVQQQRAALNVVNSNVLISWGGLAGDCGLYHGWVESVPESGLMITYPVFETDAGPGQSEGAVWAAGGPTVDPATGYIYVPTGNGSVTDPTQAYDYSDGVIQLNAADLSVRSYFAPGQWADDNAKDADLGSVSPALVGSNQVFIVGKTGIGYLLNRANLGGISGQIASAQVCPNTTDAAFGAITYIAPVAYVPCAGGIVAVTISGNSFSILWTSSAGTQGPVVYAGGLLWSAWWDTGTLHALDPATGNDWNSWSIYGINHFATPTAAGGLVIVNGGTRTYALHPDPTVVPGTGHVLDAFGNINSWGGAAPVNPSVTWGTFSIARSMGVNSDTTSGYVLDGYGGLHAFNAPTQPTPPGVSMVNNTYWPYFDIARGVAMRADGKSGYVLDGYGGLHAFAGGAGTLMPPPVHMAGNTYWPYWDVAKSLVMVTDTTGYVLDGYGGIHPFSDSDATMPPYVQSQNFPWGFNIARGIVLRNDKKSGFVVDGYGGVHPFTSGAIPMPPVPAISAYWGYDIGRGLKLRNDSSGFVLDGYGGTHPFGGAPAAPEDVYLPGRDVFKATG